MMSKVKTTNDVMPFKWLEKGCESGMLPKQACDQILPAKKAACGCSDNAKNEVTLERQKCLFCGSFMPWSQSHFKSAATKLADLELAAHIASRHWNELSAPQRKLVRAVLQ